MCAGDGADHGLVVDRNCAFCWVLRATNQWISPARSRMLFKVQSLKPLLKKVLDNHQVTSSSSYPDDHEVSGHLGCSTSQGRPERYCLSQILASKKCQRGGRRRHDQHATLCIGGRSCSTKISATTLTMFFFFRHGFDKQGHLSSTLVH
jgi:hypothetical protein